MKNGKLLTLLVVSPIMVFYLFGMRLPNVEITRSYGGGTTTIEIGMLGVLLANPFELIFTSNKLTWFDSFYMLPWFANPVLVISMSLLFMNRHRSSMLFALLSFLLAAWFVVDPHYFNVYEGLFISATPLAGYYTWLFVIGLYTAFLASLFWYRRR